MAVQLLVCAIAAALTLWTTAVAAATTPAPGSTGAADPLAFARAVPLPSYLTLSNPTLFSHWTAGSTVVIEWQSHDRIPVPPAALPPPIAASDYGVLRDEQLRAQGAAYRQALEAAQNAANRPLCDWSAGVDFTYQLVDTGVGSAAAGEVTALHTALATPRAGTGVLRTDDGVRAETARLEWQVPYGLVSGHYRLRVTCRDPARSAVYGDSVRFEVRNPLDFQPDRSAHWPTILAYVVGGISAFSLVILLVAYARSRCQAPASNRAGAATTRLSAMDIAFGRSDTRRYATSGSAVAGDEEDDPTYDRVDGPQHRRVAATDDY